MNANPLTATELINRTKEELLRTGYTQLSLKEIDRVWMNLEKYLHSKGVDNFSPEAGITFLEERYHYSADPKSHSNTDRLRAIQLLTDFQAHERILIRRRRIEREIAQPFHEVFHTFMNARAREGISSKMLDSYMIYLERFAQYLVDHQVHSMPEINVPHIHGFVQACAAAYRTATVYCTACMLRVLFRYLYEQQFLSQNLALVVPSVKCAQKSKIPSAYSQEEIR